MSLAKSQFCWRFHLSIGDGSDRNREAKSDNGFYLLFIATREPPKLDIRGKLHAVRQSKAPE